MAVLEGEKAKVEQDKQIEAEKGQWEGRLDFALIQAEIGKLVR